ncbi:MAG: MFS transporter [Actinomycetota bacterium]
MVDLSPAGRGAAPDRQPSVLRLPNFRRLWVNLVLFALVTNAVRFAFIVVVVRVLERSEGSAGLVGFTIGLPIIFFVLQAGALADRVDRKLLLVGSQIGVLVTVLGTGVLLSTDRVGMAAVIALTLVAGTFHAIGQPVRMALIPALVPRERLLDAVALNAVGMTSSMIFGPFTAEIATELWGVEGAFFVLAVLMATGLLVVVRLEVPDVVDPAPKGSMWPEIRAGVRYVVADRPLRVLFLLLSLGNLVNGAMVMTLLPSFVAEVFGRDAQDAGTMLAIMGAGLLASSFVVMRLGSMPRKGEVFLRAFLCGSTCLMLLSIAPSFPSSLVVMFLMGASGGFYINMNQSLVQSRTPDPLMGRVMSLYSFSQQGLMPLGALVAGLVASVIGLRPTFGFGGLLAFAVVVGAYLTQRELRALA